MEITEEQRKLAAKFENEQNKKLKMQADMIAQKEKAMSEAEAVAKYLLKQEIKNRRTQLMIEKGKQRTQVNVEYVLGK